MKKSLSVLLFFLASSVCALADNANDPLLDAKVNLVMLAQRYSVRHPKYMEAQAHLDAVAKAYSTSDPAFSIHVQQRLKAAEIEQSGMKFRYGEKHPTLAAMNIQVNFLREELRQIQQKPPQ